MMLERFAGWNPEDVLDALNPGDIVTFHPDETNGQRVGFVVRITPREPRRIEILFLRTASGYGTKLVLPGLIVGIEGGITPAKHKAKLREIVRNTRSSRYGNTTKAAIAAIDHIVGALFERDGYQKAPDSGRAKGSK